MYYSHTENRSRKYVNFLTRNANLGAIVCGMLFINVNTCIAEILRELDSQSEQERDFVLLATATALPFGAIFGGIISNFFANKYGRRLTMIIADLLTILGVLFSTQSSLEIMLFSRVVCGVATGINFMIIPLYVREISPPEMSGSMGSDFRISFSIGLLVPILMSIGLLLKENIDFWKIIMISPCLLSIARIFCFLKWIRMDTPQYYIENGQEESAIVVLEKIFEGDRVDKIHHREKRFEMKSFWDIFGDRYRKQVIIVTLLIFAGELMGSNAINFYTTTIFAENDCEEQEIRILNILFMLARLVASIGGKFLVDKTGRKPLIVYGTIGSIFIAVPIIICEIYDLNPLQNVLFIMYTAVQGLTLSLVLPIYASELLPSLGVSLQVVIQMFSILIIAIIFATLGTGFSFSLFAGVGLVTLFPIWRLTKETKGKTINEVYAMFNSGNENGIDDDFDEEDALNNFDRLRIL